MYVALRQVLELSMGVMGGVAEAVMKVPPEQMQEQVALVRAGTLPQDSTADPKYLIASHTRAERVLFISYDV